jgi:hypothetical protein
VSGPGTGGLRYLQAAAGVLAPLIAAAPATLVGCSDAEIAALEAMVAPHRLPAAYREFLRYGGKELAGVFGGVDFSYKMARILRASGNRDVLSILRRSDRAAMLPVTLFVLNEHLGSNFTWFDLGAGDDPPVYLWEEPESAAAGPHGLDTAIREHDTFSAFVLVQAQIKVEYLRRAGSYPHQPSYSWSPGMRTKGPPDTI